MIRFKGLSTVMDKFLADQSFRRDATGPGRIQLCGIRGCVIGYERGKVVGISTSDKPEAVTNRYDDVMVVYGFKPGGQLFSALYPMSTQPGIASTWLKGYLKKGKGCPTVQAGQYPYRRCTKYDLHQGKYWALRTDRHVLVIRDVDKDTIPEPETDLWDYPCQTGINIHAGGASAKVDFYSAGCQVIKGGYRGHDWKQFHDFCYETASSQSIFHYALIDGRFLGEWYNASHKPTDPVTLRRLYFGSQGERVRLLQAELQAKGYYHARGVDGDFGTATHQAVRRWQRAHEVAQSGVVGEGMMAALGVKE